MTDPSIIERPVLFIVTALISIPIYIKIGQSFYDDWEDVLESMRLVAQPNWLSALRGEWNEDIWASLKFIFFMATCASAATALYKLAKLIF